MRTEKQLIAMNRNWDLFQISGMLARIRVMSERYPRYSGSFYDLEREVANLRTIVELRYQEDKNKLTTKKVKL